MDLEIIKIKPKANTVHIGKNGQIRFVRPILDKLGLSTEVKYQIAINRNERDAIYILENYKGLKLTRSKDTYFLNAYKYLNEVGIKGKIKCSFVRYDYENVKGCKLIFIQS